MARTRPPKETMLLPAAPVDWETPLVVGLAPRLTEALGPEGERIAPVELGLVALPPGTIGVTMVGTGATGVAVGTTGVTTAGVLTRGTETEGTPAETDGTTTGALDGWTTGGVAGGAWI